MLGLAGGAYAGAAADQLGLDRTDPAQFTAPVPSALQTSYGVGYRLKGTFSLRGGTPYLNTPDGRKEIWGQYI